MINHCKTLICISLLWSMLAPLGVFAQSNEEIVGQFFPQRLIDDSEARFNRGGPAPSRFFDFVVSDLDVTGEANYIVAAYTNGFLGSVRVLKKATSGFVLVADPDMHRLGGIYPMVRLLDLDTDGRPEIIVSFSSFRTTNFFWVFQWTGSALEVISPVINDEGEIDTIFVDPAFADLDGEGKIDIMNFNESTNTIDVFKLIAGKYTLTGTLPSFPTTLPPLANAGTHKIVDANTVVTLDGSQSFATGGTLTFTWTQTSGSTITLSDPASATPTFIAPQVITATVLTFQLVINDGALNSVPATVNVTVRPTSDTAPPILNLPANIIAEATSPAGTAVPYTVSATDLVDGAVTPICMPISGSTFALGTTNVGCSATDRAGNTASGGFSITVRDTTPPTITGSASPAANANGWRNSAVTVSFTCADAVSGIAACTAPQTLGQGANQSVNGTATDNTGNIANAIVTGINVDLTAPAVSVTGVANGATYTLGSVPATGCMTTDALSGVQTNATLSVTGGDSSGVGTFTANCTGATDKAGYQGAASVTYQVNGVPPGGDSTFSAFIVNQLRINQRLKTIFLLSNFTLGQGNNGIDPVQEAVTLRIANFTTTIPAGSFRKGHAGVYVFVGKINKVSIEVLITPSGTNRFLFQAAASDASLSGITNPVTMELTIGNDHGTASVNAIIK